MKKILALVLALVMLFALAACGQKEAPAAPSAPTSPSEPAAPNKAADPIKLVFTFDVPDGDYLVEAGKAMCERITERTEGRYVFEVYPGGQVATGAQLFGMMDSGTVHMGEATVEHQSDADFRFTSVQLPFVFKSLDANNKYNQLINEKLFNKIFEEKFNAMPIATFSTGCIQYNGTGAAAKTLDDLSGQLLWTASTMAAETATALGGSPVNLEFWDGYPALQKKTVDASIANNPYAVLTFKWYDAVKSLTMCYIHGSATNIYLSTEVFNAMSAEDQAVFLDEGKKLQDEMITWWTDINESLPGQVAEEGGVEVYELPESERQVWYEATQPVRDAFFEKLDPAEVEIIMECLEEANK